MQDQPGKLPDFGPAFQAWDRAQPTAFSNPQGRTPEEISHRHRRKAALQKAADEKAAASWVSYSNPGSMQDQPGKLPDFGPGHSHRRKAALQKAADEKAAASWVSYSNPDSMQDQPGKLPDFGSASQVQEQAQPTALSNPSDWTTEEISHIQRREAEEISDFERREVALQKAADEKAAASWMSYSDSMQGQPGKLPDFGSASEVQERAQPTALSNPSGWTANEISHSEPKAQPSAHANAPQQTRNQKGSLREQFKAEREKVAADQAARWENSFTPAGSMRDQPTHLLWAQPATPEQMKNQKASRSRAGSSAELGVGQRRG
jgi:hypothetical protein